MTCNKDKFFEELTIGDLFTYSDGYLLGEVKNMAERRGLELRYCPPKSIAYEAYGSMTVQVVKDRLVHVPQMFHFDTNQLDI